MAEPGGIHTVFSKFNPLIGGTQPQEQIKIT